MTRALLVLVAGLVTLGIGCSFPTPVPQFDTKTSANVTVARESVQVIGIVDGDTVKVTDYGSIRIRGIDTPETLKPGTAVECYGPQATQFARDTLAGQAVSLVLDHGDLKDRYGRYVAEVWLGGHSYAELAARAGTAREYLFDPAYPATDRDAILAAQTDAQNNARGMWGAC